jgi:hypothetical protein
MQMKHATELSALVMSHSVCPCWPPIRVLHSSPVAARSQLMIQYQLPTPPPTLFAPLVTCVTPAALSGTSIAAYAPFNDRGRSTEQA